MRNAKLYESQAGIKVVGRNINNLRYADDTTLEMGIPDQLTCLVRSLYAGQEATVKTYMEQWTGTKLGKEYVKAVYCLPAYLTSMQSTSCKMLG